MFNLSIIPENANITSAVLKLYLTSAGSPTSYDVGVYRINQSWIEENATWVQYNSGSGNTNNWSAPGGDFALPEYSNTSIGKTVGWYSWDIRNLVKEWVNGTYTNYGVLLKTGENSNRDDKTFASSDNSNSTIRPMLIVNYTIPLNITFLPPTPANASTTESNFVYVNVSLANGNATTANLEWAGSNQTMFNSSGSNWYYNKTNLSAGTYTYKVYANDSDTGIFYVSETRAVIVQDNASPAISFVSPTPANGAIQSSNTLTMNVTVTDDFSVDSCKLEWNGINESMTMVGSGTYISCEKTKTNLSDGTYTFRVYSNDTSNNINVSVTRSVTIDSTAPVLGLTYPSDNEFLKGSSIEINGTASDVNPDTVVINDSRWSANIGNYTNWKFVNTSAIADGAYSVRITANDTAGNNNSIVANFTIDTTAPVYQNISGPRDPINYSSGVNYVFSVIWMDATTNINSVKFELNDINYTPTQSGNNYSYTTQLAAGLHTYRWHANDSAGNSNSTEMLNFEVNKATDSITLTINGIVNGNATIPLGTLANVSAISASGTHQLYRNGNLINYFDNSNLSAGKYLYTVNSTGNENYTGASISYYLFIKPIIIASGFNGTNFSAIDDSTNITNLILEKSNFGRINFLPAINISRDVDLDSAVIIDNNLIRINSTALPELNKSALLTLYGITYTDPKPQYDPFDDGVFIDCPSSVCQEVSYSNGSYAFNVTHFSGYRAAEGYVAQQQGGGGGNGGGNSGSVQSSIQFSTLDIPITNKTGDYAYPTTKSLNASVIIKSCEEVWYCSEWSDCDSGTGKMHRTCSDLNSCGTENNKPITQQDCRIPDEYTKIQAHEKISYSVTGKITGGFTQISSYLYILAVILLSVVLLRFAFFFTGILREFKTILLNLLRWVSATRKFIAHKKEADLNVMDASDKIELDIIENLKADEKSEKKKNNISNEHKKDMKKQEMIAYMRTKLGLPAKVRERKTLRKKIKRR